MTGIGRLVVRVPSAVEAVLTVALVVAIIVTGAPSLAAWTNQPRKAARCSRSP